MGNDRLFPPFLYVVPVPGVALGGLQGIMNKATEIYLALGLDKSPKLRRIAACIAATLWLEMHHHGEFSANVQSLKRLIKRWRLGDYICALSAHYPVRR